MSVTHHKVQGFDNAKNLITDLNSSNEVVYVLFSGARDSDGKSWCPDCVKAEPVIDDFLSSTNFKENINVIHVGIERALWKDDKNEFRTDSKMKLKVIPTLMKWGGPQKLEEGECADKQFLQMLFENSI